MKAPGHFRCMQCSPSFPRSVQRMGTCAVCALLLVTSNRLVTHRHSPRQKHCAFMYSSIESMTSVSDHSSVWLGGYATARILDASLPRNVTEHTCVLMISQSGQTFSTLHSTRKIARICRHKVWIMTGTPNSQMEIQIKDSYLEVKEKYLFNRVFLNQSGS